MKKAFIFTLDALFAVSILAVFFVVYSFEMNVPKETYWLPGFGDNFMTSLDKSGVLYDIYSNPAAAQSALTYYLNTLPPNINAKITVSIYSVGVGDVFIPSTPIEANKGTISQSQETHIKRVFSDPATNRFGIAELVMSYG